MKEQLNSGKMTIGVVGLGLMGSSIIVSLLLSGHRVIAIAPIAGEKEIAALRIKNQLILCEKTNLLSKSIDLYLESLIISYNYGQLAECSLVHECVLEKIEIKKSVYKKIIAIVQPETIIASNTSAIPITELQQYVSYPERFIGIHWSEPAFTTRFMEITCGGETSTETAEKAVELAYYWGKEPTLLKKDIRGFITNRLMYAVYREALSLVEDGQASLADVDKAFRYDTGSWITLMGIFRRMDYLGLHDYPVIFKTVFTKLCNNRRVPKIMQHLVDIKASGTQNHKGLYSYTREEAESWDKAFAAFSREIYQLAALYPSEPVSPVLSNKVLHNVL